MSNNLFQYAVDSVKNSISSFCKFISSNDLGLTGGHQAGYYVSNEAGRLMFDCKCEKGSKEKKQINIHWCTEEDTDSVFTYYGEKSRNEARITCFGRGFEFMDPKYLGSLLVVCRLSDSYYNAVVLTADDDIDLFLSQFNLPLRNFNLIEKNGIVSVEDRLQEIFTAILAKYQTFPDTVEMSQLARTAYNEVNHLDKKSLLVNPDATLLNWLSTETALFFQFEEKLYKQIYTAQYNSCESFIQAANKLLNSRKSRAGKSLEHQLSSIFSLSDLRFEEQIITESNKKPDFIFPGAKEYHNFEFPAESLVFLGAKTTCKDRWRQVLNEANRIDTKYLFTLQPGISSNQLKEMKSENLILVVPKDNIGTFDPTYRDGIIDLKAFINMVAAKQSKCCFSI